MGSPALGGEAARAPIVIFDINEVVVEDDRDCDEDGRDHDEDDHPHH